MKALQTSLMILSAAALLACATDGIDRDVERLDRYVDNPRLGEPVNQVCFKNNIDDFRQNTRDSVIMRRGVSDDYLVFVNSCRDLEYANAIAFEGSGTCLRRQDRLIVFQNGLGSQVAGRSPNFCAIDSIYKWDEGAENAQDEP